MKKRTLIADDHPMVRKGLKALLAHHFENIETAEAGSCNETMRKMMKDDYSHLILDMRLTDGTALEILPNIVNVFPGIRIMIFSLQPPDVYQRAIKNFRIKHFLSKSASEDDVVCMLGKFLTNESPPAEDTGSQVADNPFSLLTARELEILHYLLRGMRSNEIGNMLNIRNNTVSTAKSQIHAKSRTNNIRELFDLASMHNIS